MKRKDFTFEIGLVFVILVFSLLLFGIYLIIDLFKSERKYTLFLMPYTILECEKWECDNVSDKLNEYNNKEYNVFFDGNKAGVFDVYYNNIDDDFYVFNNANENIFKDQVMFAYKGKANVSQIGFEKIDVSEEEMYDLRDIKDLKDLFFSRENISKVIMDFDGDSSLESLYVISSDDNSQEAFSVLIYKDKNEFYVIDKKVSDYSSKVGFSYI